MDNALLGAEARDLMGTPIDHWHLRFHPHPGRVRPWSARKAEREFLRMYYQINPLREKAPRWSFFWKGWNVPLDLQGPEIPD